MIARVYGRWMPAADLVAGEKAELMWSQTENENKIKLK